MPDHARIVSGYEVYSWDGQRVGSVSQVDPPYFVVPTGFLGLGHPLYIPNDAVWRVEEVNQRVDLNVAGDAIPVERWKNRPAAASQVAAVGSRDGTGRSGAKAAGQSWIEPQDLLGMILVSWDNQRIGEVSGVELAFVDLQTGFHGLDQTLHVPYSAINFCDAHGCHINMSLEQIKRMGWEAPATVAEPQISPTAPPRHTAAPQAATLSGPPPVRIPRYEEDHEGRKHRARVGEVVIHRDGTQE